MEEIWNQDVLSQSAQGLWIESGAGAFTDKGGEQQGDEEREHCRDGKPRSLNVVVQALLEQFPPGRGGRRQAETEEIERGQRGNAVDEPKGQDGDRRSERIGKNLMPENARVAGAHRARGPGVL